jgi:hypothetical protein
MNSQKKEKKNEMMKGFEFFCASENESLPRRQEGRKWQKGFWGNDDGDERKRRRKRMRKKWDKVGKCASPDSIFSSSFTKDQKKASDLAK